MVRTVYIKENPMEETVERRKTVEAIKTEDKKKVEAKKKTIEQLRKSKKHGLVYNIETGKNNYILQKDATANDLPLFAHPSGIRKNNRYRDAVILDIGKKLRDVKDTIGNCDYDTLTNLCNVSKFVDIHRPFLYDDPYFDILDRDVMRSRENFIDGCKLLNKTKEK